MLNLEDLAQLAAFYEYGTLTKVAEEFLISQPTITRNMKRLEETFGVPLFVRSANKLTLNETGIQAARYARELLSASDKCLSDVRDFDRKLHTITVESCAPAPLWKLIPELSKKNPEKTISSSLEDHLDQIEEDLLNGNCTYAILPYPLDDDNILCTPYIEEHLSICVAREHALANYREVTTDLINGHNCLLSSEIGFWNTFCKKNMPSSRFLIQTDDFAFRELIKASTLPYFTTDLAADVSELSADRITIPITDADANVTYYLCMHKNSLS